jgi:dTMP kinase
MPAIFIDLEGIDQSGKQTQARLLMRKLQHHGLKTVSLDFPLYSTPAGREIRALLDGKRNYGPHATHMLYSLNRWENEDRITEALDSADVLLTDRYTPSNLAYGVAKALDVKWLVNLDRGLPEPDKILVLDVPVRYSFARKRKRRDLHESDRGLLLRVRKNYLKLASKFRWSVVDASRGTEEVHSEILRSIPIQVGASNIVRALE